MADDPVCHRFRRDKFITYRDVDSEETDEEYLVLNDGTKIDLSDARFCFFTMSDYDHLAFGGDGWTTTKGGFYIRRIYTIEWGDDDIFCTESEAYPIIYLYDAVLQKAAGGKTMDNNMIQTMMMMKMLDGSDDFDLGKMYLMQQMTSGKPLQLTAVMKSKIISKLKLDGDDLPLEKMMLLQMLDGDSGIDMTQIIAMKMLGSMFDEKPKSEKK